MSATSAELDGYWILDPQRSEFGIDRSALSKQSSERLRTFDALKHDPVSVCMPYGMPRVMSALGAFPMEIVQSGAQVTMIFDAHDEVRRIFLTPAPKDVELAPLWLGYAHGQWQGSTLHVETRGITDQSLVDASGVPHSDQLKIVERFRVVDANTLLNEMTLHDPAAFTRPVTRRLYYKRVPAMQQREFHCAERQWLDHVMNRAKELTRDLAEPKQ